MTRHLLMHLVLAAWIGIVPAANSQDIETMYEDKLLPALVQKDVQAELELVGDQKEKLQQVMQAIHQKRKDLGEQLRESEQAGASQEELENLRRELVEQFEREKAGAQDEILRVLLPHQIQRLRQATTQLMIRESARKEKVPTPILLSQVREYLEIEDHQAQRINEKANRLQQELMEKFRKLQLQAQQELMEELDPKQQARYKELVGDPLHPETSR